MAGEYLELCREYALADNSLLTCDGDNPGSIAVIEKEFGIGLEHDDQCPQGGTRGQ